MSRRLQAEIEKTAREVKATIEAYDERWQELRRFNQNQIGVKERMWQEARREQMRGKKHAVRTATLELLDFKHVCDSKMKMESDLETCLRKLHRQKQQLIEWLNMSELRTQYDELRDWKKQIELRYKRGRIFYCLGHSSEDSNADDRDLSDSAAEQLKQITEILDKLKKQSAQWRTEIDQIDTSSQVYARICAPFQSICLQPSEKKTQLDAFIELHHSHIEKLRAIAEGIGSKRYIVR